MAVEIKSGAGASALTIDPTSLAARSTLYDASGNIIIPANRGAVSETISGVLQAGKDYKLARTLRTLPSGAMAIGQEVLLFYDAFEGTTRNSNLWMENLSGMTSAQTVATGLQLNNGSIATNASNIREFSQRKFPKIPRVPLIFRARVRQVVATNSVGEFGFCEISATDISTTDGCFFRRDAAGALKGVIAVDGTEVLTAAITAPAGTDYVTYEIFWEDDRATFQVFNTDGTLLSSAVLELTNAIARICSVTHVAAFFKINNTGATVPAHLIYVESCAVFSTDSLHITNWSEVMSGLCFHSLISPTLYSQTHQYANSAAPAAATLSNAAVSYSSLGGHFLGPTPTPAGAATDFALFGFQVPEPFTFMFAGININVSNRGAAVATTATQLEWAMAFGASAASLATGNPYPPMRVPIGRQIFPIAAAVDSLPGNPIITWQPRNPIPVHPSRFIHIILRIPVGTATASGFLQGSCNIDGWFE